MRKDKNIILSSIKLSLTFLVIFWILELIQYLGMDLVRFGIYPRQTVGLLGILTSPFIHGGWDHLIANSLPFFVLSTFLFLFYKRRATLFMLLIWILTGVLTWIIGRSSWHIGASGVIYGLATFLVMGGIMSRNWKLIMVSVIVVSLYSGLIWGVFPQDTNVSWEGHLSGAISGIILAILYKKILRSPEYK